MNQKLKMVEKSRIADLNSKLSTQLSEEQKANKQLKLKISSLEQVISQTKKELEIKSKEINRLKNKLQSIEDPAFFKETDFLQLCSFKLADINYELINFLPCQDENTEKFLKSISSNDLSSAKEVAATLKKKFQDRGQFSPLRSIHREINSNNTIIADLCFLILLVEFYHPSKRKSNQTLPDAIQVSKKHQSKITSKEQPKQGKTKIYQSKFTKKKQRNCEPSSAYTDNLKRTISNPTEYNTTVEDVEECPICLDPYGTITTEKSGWSDKRKEQNFKKTLDCSHSLCNLCLKKWTALHPGGLVCPMCRNINVCNEEFPALKR